jgi:hypothetical protein
VCLKPDDPAPLINLGFALQGQGKFAEAVPLIRRAHELSGSTPGWRHPSADWAREAERMAALEPRLPRLLSGEQRLEGADDLAALGLLCLWKGRYADAARFFGDAFKADPRLADDLRRGHRFLAAGAAARAGCGQGEGAGTLTDAERARLRTQARTWLRADLDALARLVAFGTPDERADALGSALRWRRSVGLAGVRDREGLERLPEAEQAEWCKLWEEIEVVIGRLYEAS